MTRLALPLPLLVVAAARGDDPPAPKPVVRLFVQDHAARSLKWADVLAGADGKLSLAPPADIPGFPALDAKQRLVQMEAVDGKLLVGVRDDEDGGHASGWVLVGAGAKYTDHGDHGHWSFRKKPFVIGSRVDQGQGNPAHLYAYAGKFYLANDRKNGYTRFDPADFPDVKDAHAGTRPRFVPGGGNHITLAAAGDAVGYATWIDGGGPNKGRVDVTMLNTGGPPAVTYSFHLPTGVIHGATAAADKVFFAPADGVCWVAADPSAKLKPDQVVVHHVPLGTDGEKPLRTGAFAAHKNHVLCVTGRGAAGKLVVLDAAAADPKPVFVPLPGGDKLKPLTPAVVLAGGKRPLALVFHDHDPKDPAADRLDVVALDPDGNGDLSDAKVVTSLAVGPSKVEGHFGHHAAAFDAGGEWAFFTNPGDGTLGVLDLETLAVVSTFKLAGTPTVLVAVGGRDAGD